MGDSQAKYNVWTTEESNELLKIMVDAVMRGWHDKNGVFNKKTVEKKILPALNEKLGYSVTKKFTAKDEIWEDYFKSHPKHEHYRTDTFEDYEDLRIAVGTGTGTEKYSIGLGDDTDARTFDIEENKETNLLDDYVFDYDSGEFVQSDKQESSHQLPFFEDSALPLSPQPRSSEVPPTTKKRDRTEFEAKSSTFNNTDPNYICEKSHTLEKVVSKIELIGNAGDTCWDAIKEVPNLDNRTRYKVLDLLNTRSKKMDFLKMTIEERSGWIDYKLNE
ncbi:uncharacterized protein At2g29880-like [Primulina tabacum]|uniref:uncharacterized protein At2g29880-like n=1 Tax=Primulina tabacum TaxID=48773 RepID=UPI003F5AB491